MKDGTINRSVCNQRMLSDRQSDVLDELQVKGENGVSDLYVRTLKSVKNRLIMDDEYDPAENLSLVRVLTMLERDLEVLSESVTDEEENAQE